MIANAARPLSTAAWWDSLDKELLEVLAEYGPMAPVEIGRRLGMSEDAVASILSMLASEGRVRIRLVEARRES